MCSVLKLFQKSFMDVLTQAYAHLDYQSKIASANAMTWIDNTSLAQNTLQQNICQPATPEISTVTAVSGKHLGKHRLTNGKNTMKTRKILVGARA